VINYISRESQTTRNVLWSPASVCLCVCLCVCLSGAARPHYCTDQGSGRDYSLVVHHWADLQSVHGFRCCSPKPQFWGREWAFSSQTREIKKHACHRNYCIDSNQILHSDKDHQMPFVDGPNTRITNSRWWKAAILEKWKYWHIFAKV